MNTRVRNIFAAKMLINPSVITAFWIWPFTYLQNFPIKQSLKFFVGVQFAACINCTIIKQIAFIFLLLSVLHWTIYITSRGLSFLTCKVKIIAPRFGGLL